MSTTKPRLFRPVAIPRRNYNGILPTTGKPFARAWPPALEAFGFTEDEFLKFIDELNDAKQGSKAWDSVGQIGGLVGKFAALDPTPATNIVGYSIRGIGIVGGIASKRGPMAMKVSFLRSANEKLFEPRGLSVQIVDTKSLREALGLKPDAPVVLPLDPATMAMGEKKKNGPHLLAAIDCPRRLIRALVGHISGVIVYPATSVALQRDSDTIAKISVKTELDIQLRRQKAINYIHLANKAKTEEKKQKYLKLSGESDIEIKLAEDSVWLLIQDLNQTPVQPGEIYTASTVFTSKTTYIGEHKDGKIHGQGILNDSEGTTFAGEFVDGEKHGMAVIKYSSGAYFMGSFENGMQSGLGIFYGTDGARYTGGYKNAKRHGLGEISHVDGRFEKIFDYKEGVANGFVTYGDLNGEIWRTTMCDGVIAGERV